MAFSLIPKEVKFFDLLDQQAENAITVSKYFREIAVNGVFDDASVKKMNDLESEGDTLCHEITDMLNRTFITPLDREDIYALAHELDDIVDFINSISSRMKLYKLAKADDEIKRFADVIEEAVAILAKAVNGLRDFERSRRILDYCIDINRLENVGDQLRDNALGKLFDTEKDPIMVIKWKGIYQSAEVVLDKCEHVAKTIEAIVVKQS
ncbi:MAG: DUF47 family protein [Elusimicrobiaceae bacterium]|nr:DUF47 family protein [Elusimicrobiaceae bacterium]